jgi:hypothetical protein
MRHKIIMSDETREILRVRLQVLRDSVISLEQCVDEARRI